MYYLQHTKDPYQRISAVSFTQCQSDYYRSWRGEDGAIPWRMFHESNWGLYELDPTTGEILKRTDQ